MFQIAIFEIRKYSGNQRCVWQNMSLCLCVLLSKWHQSIADPAAGLSLPTLNIAVVVLQYLNLTDGFRNRRMLCPLGATNADPFLCLPVPRSGAGLFFVPSLNALGHVAAVYL